QSIPLSKTAAFGRWSVEALVDPSHRKPSDGMTPKNTSVEVPQQSFALILASLLDYFHERGYCRTIGRSIARVGAAKPTTIATTVTNRRLCPWSCPNRPGGRGRRRARSPPRTHGRYFECCLRKLRELRKPPVSR